MGKIIGIIGKGAFAKVYGAECISKKNKKVAVKVIKLETDDDPYGDSGDMKPLQIADIQQEAAIMSQLRHANIVSCYTSFVVRDELWLIMPFVSGGSISYILSHSLNGTFSKGIKDENILCGILKDMLLGISYMHNQGRIHRDIKGRNILIDGEDGTSMLADFGVSGALLEGGLKKRGRNTMTGTPCWMAPEVMKHQRYNHKADIWSLGITALELAFATTPYTKLKSPMKVMMEIMDGKPPSVDAMDSKNEFSKHFKNFINKCLIKDPQKRFSAQELLSLPFISKYSKDRQFMIQHFVKHIKKIQIKQCNELDLPSSVLDAQKIALKKQKSKKFQVKVDPASGDEANNEDFTFSTSLSVGDLDVDSLKNAINNVQDVDGIDDDDDDDDNDENATKKGKFTVTKIKEEKPKQSKFTVTSVNGNKSKTTEPKKKSRFQVTPDNDN